MNKQSLVLAVCMLAAAASSAHAQIDLSGAFPDKVRKVKSVFDGDLRLASGTQLIIQSELPGGDPVLLQGGKVVTEMAERPYVQISMTKETFDPTTNMDRKEARPLDRGAELVVTGDILCFQTAFDMGDYVISLTAKFPDGSTGAITIGMPEKARRFMTATELKEALGDVVRVAQP